MPHACATSPLWGPYSDTVLEFPAAEGLRVDLRRPVAPPTAARLASLGPAPPWGWVTAANPGPVRLRETDNRRRHRLLCAEVEACGAAWTPCRSSSIDGTHYEDGVVLPADVARRLARRWQQAAIFVWDGRHFWIEPALDPRPPQVLPACSEPTI